MDGLIAASAAVVGFVVVSGVMTYRLWQAGMRQARSLLSSRVLERAGVSLASCSDTGTLARAGAAARSCLRCRGRAVCLRWLEGDESISLRQFCPNDDVIARLAAPLRDQRDHVGVEARLGAQRPLRIPGVVDQLQCPLEEQALVVHRDADGSVYSFDGKTARVLLNGVTISNGLAWSPSYKTFYYIDTPTRQVKAFDYDVKTGEIANPRVALHVPAALGWADGMTSDVEGNLWIALWGGAQVTRWNPNTGQLLEQIPVPALQSSCPVFGGKDRNELYITSARVGMSETDLTKYPLSGGLFKVTTKFEGMPTFEFG